MIVQQKAKRATTLTNKITLRDVVNRDYPGDSDRIDHP